jgi:hypothetical protein
MSVKDEGVIDPAEWFDYGGQNLLMHIKGSETNKPINSYKT